VQAQSVSHANHLEHFFPLGQQNRLAEVAIPETDGEMSN